VDPRKRQIPRADHERNEEVSQDRRNRRDQKEEHHDDAVHREELVVGLRADEVARRSQELEADQQREDSAEDEEERNREKVEQGDPLVIAGEQPRLQAVAVAQVIGPSAPGGRNGAHGGGTPFCPPRVLMYAISCKTWVSLNCPA